MKIITMAAASAAMAFVGIPFASPAAAQGAEAKFPVPSAGCPKTHFKSRRGSDTIFYCYPKESSNDDSSSSSSGSSVDASVEARLGTTARLTKPSRGNRCPTGWSSTEQLTECFTMIEDAPTARPKGNKPCAPGELTDFDLWCTSNYAATTKRQAYSAMAVDFNRLYTSGFQNMEPVLSADATAHFGPDTPTVSSTSESSSDSSQSAEQTAQNAACQEGSATGAAIGGALGGEAGAALGSMLGGLGKKKKKKGC